MSPKGPERTPLASVVMLGGGVGGDAWIYLLTEVALRDKRHFSERKPGCCSEGEMDAGLPRTKAVSMPNVEIVLQFIFVN